MIQIVRLTLIFSLFLTQPVFAVQTIDPQSGLIIDLGYKSVQQYCSTCHSLEVVIQSKASRQGWIDTIRWMQKDQGMPFLSKVSEKIILNYLTKNYSPNNKGRRSPLFIKKWDK
ncbi:MAG: hypothetical protein L3J75_10380 [Methylococcaceae bacterium]|nr:hypothetical protein [Methylococcaceae bacterium]